MTHTIPKEVLCMNVDAFSNFALFLENIERLIESKSVFGNHIG